MARVSSDDLAFAAEWLDAYEAAPNDEANAEKAARVSAWLKAEVARRAEEAVVRDAAKQNGVSIKTVRRALAKIRNMPPDAADAIYHAQMRGTP